MKESFIIHTDDSECIEALTDEQAGKLFKALMSYSKDGVAPELSGAEAMAFLFMKKQLDRDNEKYRETCEKRKNAGALGGRPKETEKANGFSDEQEKANGFENKAKKANGFSEKQMKAKKPDTDSDSDTDSDTDSDFNLKKEMLKEKVGIYHNVLLLPTEIETLKQEFPKDWQERIDRLSEYIEQTGKQYRSHFATIRVWARKNEDVVKSRDGTRKSSLDVLKKLYVEAENEEARVDTDNVTFMPELSEHSG